MRFYILTIFLFPLLCLTSFPAFGQSGNSERYGNIELYRRWQENELRDSVYHKAYLKYVADSAAHSRLNTLAPLIRNKALWKEYNTIISASAKTAPGGDDSPERISGNIPAESDKIENLLSLADRAAKKHDPAMELEALRAAFTEAFWVEKKYGRAFYIGFLLEEKLPQVSEAEYPYKRKIFYKLGEAYYLFLDFEKSVELLKQALSPVPLSFDDTANLDALKILGICYANIGRMDLADDYFRAALLSEDLVLRRPLYNAYAISHLGCNEMLKGNYDRALKFSSVVWPTLRKTEDYGHLAGMCYCRGRSYLQKGDYRQASQWIDSLVYFTRRDRYNPTKRIKQAYLLQADYFSALGDSKLTKIYRDSLTAVYKANEKLYTSHYIDNAVRKYNAKKMEQQECMIRTARIRIVVLILLVVCSTAVAVVITTLYRKKNAAYKALAQKADRWAREEAGTDIPSTANGKTHTDEATEEDRKIMSLAKQELAVNHAYRDSELAMESLADRIGVHRNALSRAINRTTGQNFSQFINGYRIKESIRIISETDRSKLYIGELCERVGFTNRSTFSRTFKQFTGISPIDFQKNKDAESNFKHF